MKIHVYGNNKPTLRNFTKEGKYKEYRTAYYSHHSTHETMVSAIEEMQNLFRKNWDVKMEVEA